MQVQSERIFFLRSSADTGDEGQRSESKSEDGEEERRRKEREELFIGEIQNKVCKLAKQTNNCSPIE